MKKFFLLLFVLTITISTTAYASEISPHSTPYDGQVDYRWEVASKNATGTSTRNSSSVLFYEGAPASRDGETDTCGVSVSYSAEVSGTFEVSSKSVASSLGFSLGKSYTFEASKTSAPLDAGEYVKAYYTKNWQRYTILQEHHKRTTRYSFDSDGNPTGIHTDDEVIATATGYIFKPIMPKITLKYFKSSARSASLFDSSSVTPYKEELYEWDGSGYVLVQRTLR